VMPRLESRIAFPPTGGMGRVPAAGGKLLVRESTFPLVRESFLAPAAAGILSRIPRSILIGCVTLLSLLLTAPAVAQQATVAVQEGPYYVDDPVLVRVTVEDFEESPQPTCE